MMMYVGSLQDYTSIYKDCLSKASTLIHTTWFSTLINPQYCLYSFLA